MIKGPMIKSIKRWLPSCSRGSRRQDAANVTPNSDGISQLCQVRLALKAMVGARATNRNLIDFNLVFCTDTLMILVMPVCIVRTYRINASESTALSFTDMPP